ncbi:unnamed protein product [Arabidopsis halleri]
MVIPSCLQVVVMNELYQQPEANYIIGGEPIVPCLVGWSLFNDTYDFTRNNQKLPVNKKGISWKSDRESKFGKNVSRKVWQLGDPPYLSWNRSAGGGR